MWNRAGICFVLLVATTIARPSKKGHSSWDESAAKLYAALHPNTEVDENPECGEYFEDDSLLQENSKVQDGISPLNAVTDLDRMWPNGIIYYAIRTDDYTSDEILKIENAITELVELTKVNGKLCVQILPRQSETDYIVVEKLSGCGSAAGRKGGKQSISLFTNASTSCLRTSGLIMHEFLHAFGFLHEHTRYDRDDYVMINDDNIQPKFKSSFEIKTPQQMNLLGTPYDYGSLMHYGAYDFAINTSIPTIIPRDPNAVIGKKLTLSEIDIERVQIFYGCRATAHSRFFKHLDPKWIRQRNW